MMKYCNNCKKETPHVKTSTKTDVNQCYKCQKCGYDRVEVGGFNYDLM
jgi:transposase-like protein